MSKALKSSLRTKSRLQAEAIDLQSVIVRTLGPKRGSSTCFYVGDALMVPSIT